MNQPAGISFAVNVNVRAEERVVNSQKIVQLASCRRIIHKQAQEMQKAVVG
jgi:hypothetical protein